VTGTYFIFLERSNRGVINGKHQSLHGRGEAIHIMAQTLYYLAHAWYVDNLEDRIHVFLVDLPYKRDLRWQGVQRPKVDVGRTVPEDEGVVI
jgi:hypothetical protein